MASGKINQNTWADFLSYLSGSSSGSGSSSTSQRPDFFQSLYNQGYVTGSPSNSTATVLNPAGNYGFSVGSIGSNANLTDAIPTVTTPGFSIGNMDPNLPGIGIGTNMIPIFNDVMTTTLDNTGFRINPNSALGSTLNFDALNLPNMGPFQDDSNIEQITVTGQRPNQGNTLNSGALASLNTPLDLGGGDGGDGEPREPDADPSTYEEIVATAKRNLLDGANTLIPGFSLMKGAYDFFKDRPEGDFTPEELEKLDNAENAANLYVDPQPTFLLDRGAGSGETTTTPGGVNVPGLGIGSLGGSRGFVGTQDVLVPATGQMGDIYSIRPGDTRGRFAAPAYVNPYADVAAQDTAFRPGFVSAAPIAAAPGTSVTDQGSQTHTDQGSQTTGQGSQTTGQVTGTASDVATSRATPQDILANINAEDGFSRDEQKQIADLLGSGEIGIGNVTKQFGVESGDVLEGLLRGGFQTPDQLTEMIRGYGDEGFQEQDLIADLLNQGRTTPEEVAGYYSANRPEFADLTPEAVTGYLNEINMGRLQNLSDVEVGKLIDSGEMTPGQAVEIYQTRYPGLKESDVMASLNQMKSQSLFAMGGVVEKADGIESLLDKRQQAVNRMLSRRAVAQFRNGGAVVKKPLAPANFAGGGIATKLIQKGAEMLGFDDARQIEITREAVDLTNQMVDAGLVDPQFRVKLRMPTSGEQSTRQNTVIEGDEEVFNAVNHALFSYHAGKSPLARAGSQAKEIYQGMRLGLAGKDPGSESLDYFNNMFGFDLARQGLSPEEAKSAIIDNIANIDNKGALSRLRAGEPLIAGKDLSRTAEDIRGSGPDVTAFDVLAGVQGLKDGGPPDKVPASVLEGRGSFYGTPYREEPKVDTGKNNLTLQQRLDEATPLEQYAFEVLGLEPGLDRGMMTPVAIRQSGDKEFALPALAYDSLKALLAPGAALSGRQVTPEETIELAMETMGSGAAMPGVDIGGDFMAGMAAKPKGGVFAPMVPEENPFSPEFIKYIPSYFAESGAETIPANYANLLINLHDMDENLAMSVAKRGENYFKKLYGTGEDPIRIKILEGDITPNFSEQLTPELLQEARDDYARFKKGGPRVTSALDAFEFLYDKAAGIRKEVNFDALGVNDMDPAQKIINSMIDEGVPPELITPGRESYEQIVNRLIREEGLDPDSMSYGDYQKYLRDKELSIANKYGVVGRGPYDFNRSMDYMDVEEYTPFLNNPSISRALETGEPIYDIDTGVVKEGLLGFLTPEQLAEGIATIPPNKLKNMSFPDIIVNVQKSGEAQEIYEVKSVAERLQTSNERPHPSFLLKKGVEKVDDFGNEGWYRITKPVYMKLEGLLMDHSVGRYYDQNDYGLGGPKAIKSGKARVFSLRNNQTGEPRLTVEMDHGDPDRPKPSQIKGPSNSEMNPSDYDKLYSLYDEIGVLVEDLPSYMQEGYKKYKETGVSGMDDYFGPA
jgi:hypothetical protein